MSPQLTSSSTFRRFKVFSSKQTGGARGDAGASPDKPKKYWLVQADSNGSLSICGIDAETWLPVGKTRSIAVNELQKFYLPEPGVYEQFVQPSIEHLTRAFSAPSAPEPKQEPEPVNEKAIIDQFQEGLAYLDKGSQDEAVSIFSKLLDINAPFEEKHKHLFNDLAIKLRKKELRGQAIAYYKRALELSWGDDENLHINLARAFFEEEQYGNCVLHLLIVLRNNKSHPVAYRFLKWLYEQQLVPKQHDLETRGFLAQTPRESIPALREQEPAPPACAGTEAKHEEEEALRQADPPRQAEKTSPGEERNDRVEPWRVTPEAAWGSRKK